MKTKEAAPAHDPATCTVEACPLCAKAKETNAASSQGALLKPPKPIESVRALLTIGSRFLESLGGADDAKREVPVLIIKEGMGNKADRHVYTAELLEKVAPLFDGVKAYANHPSKTEETDRPERDVREIVGYYQDPKVVMIEGKSAIQATLKIIDGDSYAWAWNLVKEAAAFAKKFKDKDLVGISINAWGASHTVEAADGILNMVDDLTEVQSADIVTQAGAGGGFRLREAVKKALAREGKIKEAISMKDQLAKHGEGLKALHDSIKSNPEHAKAYGPAMEALLAHHAEMAKASEAAPAAAAPDSSSDDGVEEKKKEAARAAANADFEKMTENYKAGKMTETEKVIFEALLKERKETAIRENVAMVSRVIKESGLPETYSDDLAILCAGKPEADVKKLVEARKNLVTPLLGNRATGAGAGAGGSAKPSKLSEKIGGSGVKLVEAKK